MHGTGFLDRQPAPGQRLILDVPLAEGQRGVGFGQFVAQVEGVFGRQLGAGGGHDGVEELVWIGVLPVPVTVHHVQEAATAVTVFDKDPKIRIGQARSQLLQCPRLLSSHRRVSQHDQAGIDMLGQHATLETVMQQATCEIEFHDGTATPVDHLGRQHAAHSKFLANRRENHVDPRTVDLGQFGHIPRPHHHLGPWPTSPGLEEPLERRCESEPNRFQDRVNPEINAIVGQPVEDRPKRFQARGHRGNGDHGSPGCCRKR